MENGKNIEIVNVQQSEALTGQVNNQAQTVVDIVGEAVNQPTADSHEPKAVGAILDEMLRSDSPFAVAYRNHFFPDTHLCVDLKLITHQQGRIPVGAYLDGIITRNGEDKFLFSEKVSFRDFCLATAQELLTISRLLGEEGSDE